MARLLSIRLTLVAIGIVVLAYIGAYAISNSLVDIWVVFAFGSSASSAARWAWTPERWLLASSSGP